MADNVVTEFPDTPDLAEPWEVEGRPAPRPEGEEGQGAKSGRRLRAKVLVPIAALLLALAGIGLYYFYAGWESTDDAQIDGYVNPISSRVAGYITRVYVDDNQYVKAGTLLAQIDPKDYQVALESAKATLANDEATQAASQVNIPVTAISTSSQLVSAQAAVDHARTGVSVAEQQFAASQASLAQAEANSAKAQDDVDRFKQLVDKHEIAEQQYAQAVDTARAAAAGVAAAHASGLGARDGVEQAKARLSQAIAELDSARTGPRQVRIQQSRALASAALAAKSKAALDQAQLNLDYTRIVAPVDGVVAKRTVQAGAYVTPGQQLLAVVPLDDIWVTANFKETQLKKMRPGLPVEVEVDAYGRTYKGHVESLAGGTGAVFSLLPPENATGNYVKVVQRLPLRIRFEQGQDPEHRLRPGMSVEPKVRVD